MSSINKPLSSFSIPYLVLVTRSHGRIVLASESLFFIDIDCIMSDVVDVDIFEISFRTDGTIVMNGVDIFFAFPPGNPPLWRGC